MKRKNKKEELATLASSLGGALTETGVIRAGGGTIRTGEIF